MSIIGISGRINSGKDTVGKIIRILTVSPHFTDEAVEDFLKKDLYESNWKIKKFSDKLKDIVCLLINCTKEQLEDREFKEKELGEEWNATKYTIIDNDDTILFTSFSKNDVEMELDYYNDYHHKTVSIIESENRLTPRLLLQFIGTNLLRNQLHPEIWVNALMSEYKTKSTLVSEVNYLGDSRCGICKKPTKDISYFLCDEHVEKSKNNFPNWIITDLRFPNELEAVKKRGGITIRVNRDRFQYTQNGYLSAAEYLKSINHSVRELSTDGFTITKLANELWLKNNDHNSETALDNAEFDYEIDNNKDILHLISEIRKILEKENLI